MRLDIKEWFICWTKETVETHRKLVDCTAMSRASNGGSYETGGGVMKEERADGEGRWTMRKREKKKGRGESGTF